MRIISLQCSCTMYMNMYILNCIIMELVPGEFHSVLYMYFVELL